MASVDGDAPAPASEAVAPTQSGADSSNAAEHNAAHPSAVAANTAAQVAASQRPAQVPQLNLAGEAARAGDASGAGAAAGAGGGAGAGAADASAADGDGASGAATSTGETPEHLLEDAREAKARGNEQFGKGKWQAAALDYHSACLLIDRIGKDHPDASDATSEAAKALLVVCLTNLCQAQLKIGVADAAYKAARIATTMAADNFKAWFLRSRAEEALGDVPAAYQSCVAAVKLKPRNATIRKRLVKLKKQKQREKKMVQRAFKGYFDDEAVAAPAPAPAPAPAAAPAAAAADSAAAAGAGGDGDASSSSSDGETDDTSSSGDRFYQDRPADQGSDGEDVEYSDAAAYRKALDMGIPPDEAGAMVARGEGPILLAGYRSVAQYKESVEIKAQREGWAAERRAKRAKRRAKKAARAAAAEAANGGDGAGAGAPAATAVGAGDEGEA